MIIRFKKYLKNLYIFFVFLSLTLFFFSTDKTEAKSFSVDNIEISKPFEINFDKNIKFKCVYSSKMNFINLFIRNEECFF